MDVGLQRVEALSALARQPLDEHRRRCEAASDRAITRLPAHLDAFRVLVDLWDQQMPRPILEAAWRRVELTRSPSDPDLRHR